MLKKEKNTLFIFMFCLALEYKASFFSEEL